MTSALRIVALSAAASLAAGAASADLTAAEVWADWQDTATGFGQTISVGSQEASGNSLTLRDVSITMDVPDGGVNGTIFEIVMTERGDGSVGIEMSPEVPLDVTAPDAEGGIANFSVVIDQSGLDLVASGAPGAVSYTYSAPSMTLRMTEATVDGEPMDLDVAVAIAGLDGAYTVTDGALRQVDSSLDAQTLTMAFSGTDPEGAGDTIDMTVALSDLSSRSSGTVSPLMGMASLTEMIGTGLATTGSMTHGPATVALTGTSGGSSFDMSGAYQSGEYGIEIGPDGLDYHYTGKGFMLTVSGDQIPLPEVSVTADEIGSRVAMPVGVSDEPQDVGFVLRLVGLTVGDDIWAMFDPMGGLPRDPATLILDIAGKANWLIDVFDPAIAEQPMDAPPGELHSLTVNELKLSIAGAELTGTGDFEMNNDAIVPQPSGTMNMQLVGANALIDTLVQMGMLPEDQAMGARMMLGLFARPGDGPDTLVSEITVQPDGAILANGQRIR